jgi:hypothetical protein
MIAARRNSHLYLLALLAIAVLYFGWLHEDDVEEAFGYTDGTKRPDYYEAKDFGPDDHAKKPVIAGDWKQEILDGLAATSTTTEPAQVDKGNGHALETSTLAPVANAPVTKASKGTASTTTSITSASSAPPKIPHPDPHRIIPTYDRGLVMGRLKAENTDWIREYLPDWQHYVYIVDSPSSSHAHTIYNKGREAMTYLTFLVEHYDSLPAYIVFLHAHKDIEDSLGAWHNEGREHDIVAMMRIFNYTTIQGDGYRSLRCEQSPGCPDRIQPARGNSSVERAIGDAWKDLFGNSRVPKIIAAPCCSQFIVTKAQVLQRPLSEYQRYFDWLLRTPLDDYTSSGVFEYLWHIIFGQDAVYCPNTKECYCDLYMQCTNPQYFGNLDESQT